MAKAKETAKQKEEIAKVKEILKQKEVPKVRAIDIAGRNFLINLIISLLIGMIAFIYYKSILGAIIVFVAALVLIGLYNFFREKLKQSARIKKMEDVFPDFIELMSSNLRAGMTVDQALLLSSRKEFAPLDEEILQLGKDIVTGKDMSLALNAMSERIKSMKISKTVDLINSGIRSGGNLSILLEETAVAMRERDFIEKKASSNVLMYVIFIFFAAAIGAPILFALSSVLVGIMAKLLSTVPSSSGSAFSSVRVPFAITKINISTSFIEYFSITFLVLTNILSSLMLGITNKGEEKAGLKYLIPMVILSLVVFFIVRTLLSSYFAGLIG